MTEERLRALPLDALRELAVRAGIHAADVGQKEGLIEQILEAVEEDRSERERSNSLAMKIKETKFDTTANEDVAPRPSEDSDLPDTYNETKIVLLLRDPLWAFAYWDMKQADLDLIGPAHGRNKLHLRVHSWALEDEGSQSGEESFNIPVGVDDRSRYLNLPCPGRRYSIDLVLRSSESQLVLCSSNAVESVRIALEGVEAEGGETSFYGILSVLGLEDGAAGARQEGIPQRVISLLDAQYLHLKG